MDLDPWFVVKSLAAAAAATFLVFRIWVTWQTERRSKTRALDPFKSMLHDVEVTKGIQGYPALRARLDGDTVVVTAYPDTLVLRTLPVLYVEARWRRRHDARVRVLVNPSGTEYYAESQGLQNRFVPPPAWSPTTDVCGSGPEALPLLRSLQRVDLSESPSLRQLLVTEGEVRVTMRAAIAHRQTYRVLRAASFDEGAVSDALAEETIRLLRTVESALATRDEAAAEPPPGPSPQNQPRTSARATGGPPSAFTRAPARFPREVADV